MIIKPLFYSIEDILFDRELDLRHKNNIVYAAKSNDKFYIGVTTQSFQERIKEHFRHSKTLFDKEVDDQFKWAILESNIANKTKLGQLEQLYISQFNSMIPNGFNQTKGGVGTHGYTHSNESKIHNSKTKKEFFKDPKNRKKVSRGVQIAHAVNPVQAEEHSDFMKSRFDKTTETGVKNRKIASQKQKDFIKKNIKNQVEHSISHGSRPFVVIKDKCVIGAFLSQAECSRRIGVQISHISQILNKKMTVDKRNGKKYSRKTAKGHSFRYIDLGLLFNDLKDD